MRWVYLFLEDAVLDELEGLDAGAFFGQRVGEGRHRTWRDAADVGVVAPARHEEHRLAVLEHLRTQRTTRHDTR